MRFNNDSKRLQKQSIYAEYDEDGDVVSDEELSHIKEIKQT